MSSSKARPPSTWKNRTTLLLKQFRNELCWKFFVWSCQNCLRHQIQLCSAGSFIAAVISRVFQTSVGYSRSYSITRDIAQVQRRLLRSVNTGFAILRHNRTVIYFLSFRLLLWNSLSCFQQAPTTEEWDRAKLTPLVTCKYQASH